MKFLQKITFLLSFTAFMPHCMNAMEQLEKQFLDYRDITLRLEQAYSTNITSEFARLNGLLNQSASPLKYVDHACEEKITLSYLPAEIMEHIFSYVLTDRTSLNALKTLRTVCHKFQALTYSSSLLNLTVKNLITYNETYAKKIFIKACGFTEAIDLILAFIRSNIRITDSDDQIALMMALVKGNPEIVSLLLSKDDNQNNQDQTALMNAQLVKLLTDAGANLNLITRNGTTALMIAAQHNPESVKLLIDAKADLNLVDQYGETALMIAAQHNSESVQLLIDAGADLNLVNQWGYTALMHTANNPESIKLLINARANLNLINKYGNTALMIAAQLNAKSIKLLIDAGANLNFVNNHGETALMRAKYNPEATQLLLNAGAQ